MLIIDNVNDQIWSKIPEIFEKWGYYNFIIYYEAHQFQWFSQKQPSILSESWRNSSPFYFCSWNKDLLVPPVAKTISSIKFTELDFCICKIKENVTKPLSKMKRLSAAAQRKINVSFG